MTSEKWTGLSSIGSRVRRNGGAFANLVPPGCQPTAHRMASIGAGQAGPQLEGHCRLADQHAQPPRVRAPRVGRRRSSGVSTGSTMMSATSWRSRQQARARSAATWRPSRPGGVHDQVERRRSASGPATRPDRARQARPRRQLRPRGAVDHDDLARARLGQRQDQGAGRAAGAEHRASATRAGRTRRRRRSDATKPAPSVLWPTSRAVGHHAVDGAAACRRVSESSSRAPTRGGRPPPPCAAWSPTARPGRGRAWPPGRAGAWPAATSKAT